MQSLLDAFTVDYDKLLKLFLPSATAAAAGQATTADGLEHSSLPGPSARPEDARQLMSNTDATHNNSGGGDITFNTFVDCFTSLRFSAILCGHRNDNSLREFFELVTRFLLEKIVDTHQVKVRITSFYLLYALWFVQSKSYQLAQLQIRITRELFTHVQSLVKYAQEAGNLDVVIAYRRLIRANAFAFVDCLDLLGPYYKTYLTRRTLTMPVDSGGSVHTENSSESQELKVDTDKYIDTLKELQFGHLTCDMLESYLDNLESN